MNMHVALRYVYVYIHVHCTCLINMYIILYYMLKVATTDEGTCLKMHKLLLHFSESKMCGFPYGVDKLSLYIITYV